MSEQDPSLINREQQPTWEVLTPDIYAAGSLGNELIEQYLSGRERPMDIFTQVSLMKAIKPPHVTLSHLGLDPQTTIVHAVLGADFPAEPKAVLKNILVPYFEQQQVGPHLRLLSKLYAADVTIVDTQTEQQIRRILDLSVHQLEALPAQIIRKHFGLDTGIEDIYVDNIAKDATIQQHNRRRQRLTRQTVIAEETIAFRTLKKMPDIQQLAQEMQFLQR